MREILIITHKNTLTSSLRKPSLEIEKFDSQLRELADEMFAQLKSLNAAGLAAPQYGENIQLFVLEIQGRRIAIVNPRITKSKGSHSDIESCMSIPNRRYIVKRPKKVRVCGFGLEGEPTVYTGHDLLAITLCHEIDHLKGLLIDKTGTITEVRR